MLQFHRLDVFTDTPYTGNPLAVVLGADGLSDAQMQVIAREFNLSETIFVQRPTDPAHTADVRIFTPMVELPFAGHPTIGCAILLAELDNTGDFAISITLQEPAGPVPVQVVRKGGVSRAEFIAPRLPEAHDGGLISPEIAAAALGLAPGDIGFDGHRINNLAAGPSFVYVPIASRTALARAQVCSPAWGQLVDLARNDSVYLYCRTPGGFAARMFAPDHGMPEDPATGSATAILAAQLLRAGELTNGQNNIDIAQGEDMGRPSQLGLSVDVDRDQITQIRIQGGAVSFNHGTITCLPDQETQNV